MADEKFELVSSYQPTGDQPQAIETLVEGVQRGDRCQTLLGVTGSGKTFTMANVIARCNRPTLVLDIKTFRTIPMAIQYFRGSYGKVEMAPMMACIMITVLPVIVLYLICQKYIIDGVVAGAVKG